MSIENPKNDELEPKPANAEKEAAHEEDLSDEALIERAETRHREQFIKEIIVGSDLLNAEQKITAMKYVLEKPGTWREYDGADVSVSKSQIIGGKLALNFKIVIEGYGVDFVEEDIPLAE